jgi:predicted nucleic acid-binding protein
MQTVYIETTIISYLSAWPSRDVIRLGDQLVTRDWWDTQRSRFELFTSELVVIEASAGDLSAAKARLDELRDIRLVAADESTARLASSLIAAAALPTKSTRDALHVAVAATNGLDYLLTWNCKHLANAMLRDKIIETCAGAGVRAPIITTPTTLFDEAHYERKRARPD